MKRQILFGAACLLLMAVSAFADYTNSDEIN